MMEIKWAPELSVGVDEIDQQHQQLFSIINQLLKTPIHNLDHRAVLSILTRLVDYSDYHFRTEDNYMIENEYPLFLSHRKEHLAYIKKTGEWITALERKDTAPTADMGAFLCSWWKGHVADSDMQYARYMKASKKNA